MTFEQLVTRSGCIDRHDAARMCARTMTIDRLLALPGVTDAIAGALPDEVAALQVAEARRKLEAALQEGAGEAADHQVVYDVTDAASGLVWPIAIACRGTIVAKYDTYVKAIAAARGVGDRVARMRASVMATISRTPQG